MRRFDRWPPELQALFTIALLGLLALGLVRCGLDLLAGR